MRPPSELGALMRCAGRETDALRKQVSVEWSGAIACCWIHIAGQGQGYDGRMAYSYGHTTPVTTSDALTTCRRRLGESAALSPPVSHTAHSLPTHISALHSYLNSHASQSQVLRLNYHHGGRRGAPSEYIGLSDFRRLLLVSPQRNSVSQDLYPLRQISYPSPS